LYRLCSLTKLVTTFVYFQTSNDTSAESCDQLEPASDMLLRWSFSVKRNWW